MPAHRLKHGLSKSRLANGAGSRAVFGDGHSSTLANQNFIIAQSELGVCDAGHRWFVMKKVRGQIVEVKTPAEPGALINRGPLWKKWGYTEGRKSVSLAFRR